MPLRAARISTSDTSTVLPKELKTLQPGSRPGNGPFILETDELVAHSSESQTRAIRESDDVLGGERLGSGVELGSVLLVIPREEPTVE